MKSEAKRKTFGWAIFRTIAQQTTVYTFSRKADAMKFQKEHASQLGACEIKPSYDRAIPPFGTEGVVYEVHTRAGGGAGVFPAGVNQFPHTTVAG